MSRKKGSCNYSLELKLEAIRLTEAGLTHAEVTERLGIRDPNRVKNWRWQYRHEGIPGLKKPHRGRPPKRENREAYIRRLEMENALLKKLHTELRKEKLAKRNIRLSTTTEKHSK
mgnify:FL=1